MIQTGSIQNTVTGTIMTTLNIKWSDEKSS